MGPSVNRALTSLCNHSSNDLPCVLEFWPFVFFFSGLDSLMHCFWSAHGSTGTTLHMLYQAHTVWDPSRLCKHTAVKTVLLMRSKLIVCICWHYSFTALFPKLEEREKRRVKPKLKSPIIAALHRSSGGYRAFVNVINITRSFLLWNLKMSVLLETI